MKKPQYCGKTNVADNQIIMGEHSEGMQRTTITIMPSTLVLQLDLTSSNTYILYSLKEGLCEEPRCPGRRLGLG